MIPPRTICLIPAGTRVRVKSIDRSGATYPTILREQVRVVLDTPYRPERAVEWYTTPEDCERAVPEGWM